jgi:hypothetical protein
MDNLGAKAKDDKGYEYEIETYRAVLADKTRTYDVDVLSNNDIRFTIGGDVPIHAYQSNGNHIKHYASLSRVQKYIDKGWMYNPEAWSGAHIVKKAKDGPAKFFQSYFGHSTTVAAHLFYCSLSLQE